MPQVYLDECTIEYNDGEGVACTQDAGNDCNDLKDVWQGGHMEPSGVGEGGGIFMIGRGAADGTNAGTAFLSIRSSTFTGNRASRSKGWGLRLYTNREACTAI